MTKYTKRINANIYLNAAVELGLKYEVLDEQKGWVNIYDKSGKSLLVKLAVLGFNSKEARTLSKDKMKSLQLLEENGIPTTLGKVYSIDDNSGIEAYCSELLKNGSLVLKKNFGKGGKHVYVDLKSISEVKEAIATMLADTEDIISEVIIEKYIAGDNYRVLVMDNQIIDVIKRESANVIGDGISTVAELIEKKNAYKKANGDVYTISPKKIDFTKLNLTYVPRQYEKFNIIKMSSLTLGGDVTKVDTSLIDKSVLEQFAKIQKVSGLVLCGIDVISKDLLTNGASYVVNEYNQAPGMSIHYLASYNYSLEVPKKILSIYFKINE